MNKKLKPHDTAPAFSAVDASGRPVSLERCNSKYILVAFFRYAGCPFCNLALHRLALEHKTLCRNDCEVIAFIQSDRASIEENIYGRHTPKPKFPIVADADRTVYDLYGVQTSVSAAIRSIPEIPYWVESMTKHGFKHGKVDGNLFLVPAMFLINGQSKKIIKAIYGTSFYDHATFTNIYESLFFNDNLTTY